MADDRLKEQLMNVLAEIGQLSIGILDKYAKYREGLAAPPPPDDLNKKHVYALYDEIAADLGTISKRALHAANVLRMG